MQIKHFNYEPVIIFKGTKGVVSNAPLFIKKESHVQLTTIPFKPWFGHG